MRNIKNAKARRSAFTLFEVLVCIVILALFLGTATPYCMKGYRSSCYDRGIKRFEQKLQAARTIAKITQQCVDIVFEKQDKGVFCSLYPAQEVSDSLCYQIEKKERLEGIRDFTKEANEPLFQRSIWRITAHPEGLFPMNAHKIVVVPDSTISPREIDLEELSMKYREDEKNVLQFFSEELQKEFLVT